MLEVANSLNAKYTDCLLSIGSNNYSDACKIARLIGSANLIPQAIVNEDKGRKEDREDPRARVNQSEGVNRTVSRQQ